MKNTHLLIIPLFITGQYFSQVGINTETPQGLLDIKNTTKKLGVVFPSVDKAENVTTPDGTQPVEATVVYDQNLKCLRYKTSAAWSGCMIDSNNLNTVLGQMIDGKTYWMTSKYSDKTEEYMQNKLSHHDFGLIFSNAADNDYLFGSGISRNGLGLGGNSQHITPAKRIKDVKTLTMAGSKGIAFLGSLLTDIGAHMIITTNGKIFAAGYNNDGRLGLASSLFNAHVDSWQEVIIPNLAPNEVPIQVQMNAKATIILTDTGNVYAAGSNSNGHTGQGTTSGELQQFTQIQFPGLAVSDKIVSIWGTFESDVNTMFSAISKTGKVYAWGKTYYQGPWGHTDLILTAGDNEENIATPQDITSFFNILTGSKPKKVLIGSRALVALADNGRIYASVARGKPNYLIGMGSSDSGTNALRDITNTVKDISLLNGEDIKDFDVDKNGAVIISSSKLIYTGLGYDYRFGDNNRETAGTPAASNWKKLENYYLNGDFTLKSVNLGDNAMLVETQQGHILVSGNNKHKALGTASGTGFLISENIQTTAIGSF